MADSFDIIRKSIEKKSKDSGEPSWLVDLRLDALSHYREIGGTIQKHEPCGRSVTREETKKLLDRIGVRENEKNYMLGISQINDKVYMNPIPEGFGKGIIVKPLVNAIKENGPLVKRYFNKIVNHRENAYAAYNTALWDGGVFAYVPKGVKIPFQINVVFIIDKERFSQVPRALLVCEENTDVKFMEGCVAPIYREYSDHKSITEILVGKNSRLEIASMQNWSPNVATKGFKRAIIKENGHIKWVDGSFGGSRNHKTLSIILEGDNSKADINTFITASKGQVTRVVDRIDVKGRGCGVNAQSKSLAGNGGITEYSSTISLEGDGSSVFGSCESLLLDNKSRSSSYPTVNDRARDSWSTHESSTFVFDKNAIDYLRSRGLGEEEARASMTMGFAKPFTLSLPVEYRRELERLISIKASA
ncbi:MAG: SufD family Fe-S cluster assembly protein [Candidatus Micrarchaeota archaeon]|nr:SufD family Fe-S cluster assembly protein [Candidatus Micrarchaeota archaeon]